MFTPDFVEEANKIVSDNDHHRVVLAGNRARAELSGRLRYEVVSSSYYINMAWVYGERNKMAKKFPKNPHLLSKIAQKAHFWSSC